MKALERRYSKVERVVAKGKFSAINYLRTLLIAVILGGLTAVVWIYKDKLESIITKHQKAMYLTDDVMRYVLLAVGIVVVISFLIETIRFNARELVITPDKFIYRAGVFSVHTTMVQLVEIKMVDTKQNFIQRILGIGDIIIVSDAQHPYRVKNVKAPERLARKIMTQASLSNKALRGGGNQLMGITFSGYAK